MLRYRLAAAVALSFALVAPAAARDNPAGSLSACAIPAAADAPVLPLSSDSSLEDKIDQLTGVIADLQDRISYLEDALDAPDDEGGGDPDQNLDLVQMRGAHHAGLAHRVLRSERAERTLPSHETLAPTATSARQRTQILANKT